MAAAPLGFSLPPQIGVLSATGVAGDVIARHACIRVPVVVTRMAMPEVTGLAMSHPAAAVWTLPVSLPGLILRRGPVHPDAPFAHLEWHSADVRTCADVSFHFFPYLRRILGERWDLPSASVRVSASRGMPCSWASYLQHRPCQSHVRSWPRLPFSNPRA